MAASARVVGPRHLEWNVAGRCSQPVYRRYEGKYHRTWLKDVFIPDVLWEADFRSLPWAPDGQWYKVDLFVSCRKCGNCLRARAKHWAHRAISELSEEGRNWFVTLTLRPEEVTRMAYRGKLALIKRGHPLHELEEKFYDLAALEMAKEVTKYIKRLRKAGHVFRYLAIEERHLSDAPHFHLLIHERGEPIRYRDLRGEWGLGFFHGSIARNDRVARYVIKYLAKGGKRIRCSLHYGKRPQDVGKRSEAVSQLTSKPSSL